MSDQLAITFEGLREFDSTITVEVSSRLTSIVGPNGAGKSTLLQAIAGIFVFLRQTPFTNPVGLESLSEQVAPVRDCLPTWRRATVEISPVAITPNLSGEQEKVYKLFTKPTVTLQNIDGHVFLQAIGEHPVDLERTSNLSREASKLRDRLLKTKAELSRYKQNPNHPQSRQKTSECEKIEARLNESNKLLLASGQLVSNHILEGAILRLFPKAIYIDGGEALSKWTKQFISYLGQLRNDFHIELATSPYREKLRELSDFLNTEVTGGGTPYQPLVARKPLNEVSKGTALAFDFFSLCDRVEDGGLIIWDEPENSLHSTRRNKVRSLMLQSTRRFLLGTHQPEFAPLFEPNSRVYKVLAKLPDTSTQDKINISLTHLTNLRDGLSLTRELGLEPSRILFTANIVLWVEGPSEAIYWRLWLEAYIRDEKSTLAPLVEGFDYSFMFTGGSLLANLTVGDSQENDELVDLLRIAPSGVVICDTDFTPEKVRKKMHGATPTEGGHDFLDQEYDRNGIRGCLRQCLKPRVRQFLSAVDSLDAPDLYTCKLTYGKDIENTLASKAIVNTISHFANQRQLPFENIQHLVERAELGRWTPTLSNLESEFSATTGFAQLFRSKVCFAQNYSKANRGLNLTTLVKDTTIIRETAEKILETKKLFNQ